jgi:molecular chaperone GrpE
MSDPATPARLGEVGNGRVPAGPLTPERVDAVLADFRGWLTELLSPPPSANNGEPPPVDLSSVVAQVTALRHEVNLQTKASRAAVEQTAEALKLAATPKPAADADEAVKPLVKALVDIADALALSAKQVEKARSAAEGAILAASAPVASMSPKPGFFAQLFRTPPPPPCKHAEVFDFLKVVIGGVGDGYGMSLRRVERVLPQFGLEPVECAGKPFDPELMEVVEAVDGNGRPSGTVVEEVRRGYRWHGKPFRFAQVKVAR